MDLTKEELLKMFSEKAKADAEQEARLIGKLETLLDEVIGLAQEGRAALKRWSPPDWTLIYGPRGTEIKRPGE